MSEKENAEVSTSSTDVYPAAIALGFYQDGETPVASCASAPTIMLPENFPDTERSIMCNKDVRDSQAVRGRCGLYNLGNTCFMNSGLQCLMSTAPLVTFLLDYLQVSGSQAYDHSLLGQFSELFAKVWSGQFTTVYPKDFKSTLGVYCTQFQDYRQHDCQEFLALLLDTLHEQLNVRHNSTNQNTEAEQGAHKQPITFEHNIINSPSSGPNPLREFTNLDQAEHVATCQTPLTFDNIKHSKEPVDMKNVSSSFDNLKEYQEKDKNRSNLVSFTVNPICEDSNHSSVSEHSSESDQCSVIQNLKLRSSPVASQSSEAFPSTYTNEAGRRDQLVSSSVDDMKGKRGQVDSFKRVQSLQDLKLEHEDQMFGEGIRMSKAFSDNDLVKKASSDIEEDAAFETFEGISDMKSGKSGITDGVVEDITNKNNTEDPMQEPVILNNAISTTSVPSLEDLYSKETKTLNTNVLSSEFIAASIAVDSEKFAKHDNTTSRPEPIEEEDLLNNVMEATNDKGGYDQKKIKDVNVRANKKSRTPAGACSSTCLETHDKEECFAVNSVKRMKFEGTEKNLQMQEMSKIQKKRLIFGDLKRNRNEIKGMRDGNELMDVGGAREVDSDSDSEGRDDHDMDVDMNLSDNEDKAVGGRNVAASRDGSRYTTSEVVAAEDAWQKYLTRNDSVIVNTFQGQFKSTVVCSDCDQVSVTFEPFMYLSVPVPHAMERQLCVILISVNAPPTRYLLNLHKHDKIQKAKQQLCALIGRDNCDVILTEVLNWHISRILEDHTVLRYINDTSRSIYAFEMDNSVSVDTVAENQPSKSVDALATSSSSQDSLAAHAGDVFSQMGSFSNYNSQTSFGSHEFNSSITDPTDYQSDDFNVTSAGGSLDMMGTGLWEWNDNSDNKRRGSLETESGGEWPMADSTTANTLAVEQDENSASTATVEQGDNSVSSTSAPVIDDWKSCAICLEELTDNELMVHTSCGGTFCPNCLEMSVQHYRDSCYCCPVCSTPADIADDFVPLANAASHKPKTRIVTIPITYRCEGEVGERLGPFLFAHPGLLNLPSNLTGQYIYGQLETGLPGPCRVVLTDGQGLHCSRCLYMEHCSGCEVPRDGEVVLRPGDHLTVTMATVSEQQIQDGQRYQDHISMGDKRSDEDTSLTDCFTAFTQSEELDEHNPWFCPHCKENRRAKKTMTVWQYPDTLIIQLKRFLFHELSSTKVDNKVVFPTEDLNLNNFISGPSTKNLHYNLYSIVCHFGGANCGHYTAYARHPVDGQWYYYNDETVSLQSPGSEEHSSTYVLFYQRKGTDRALEIPEDLDLGISALDTPSESHGATTGAAPAVTFTPPEREITLEVNAPTPSTSSHEVASSTAGVDLVSSADVSTNEREVAGKGDGLQVCSSHKGAEQAEADSTDVNYDFYS